MTVSRARSFVSACLAILGACLVPARAADLQVFAAASLTDALKEIGPAYEAASGDKLQFNLAGSNALARQIQEGVPADVFLSADEAKMDALEKAGLLVDATRSRLLSNSLVVVVTADSTLQIASAKDLAGAGIKRLALADTKGVPAGVYAREYLEQIGVWEAVKDRVVPTENVRAALAAVESGNAEAGIVYKTDALISKTVKVAYEVPVAEGPKISYPVAVIKASKNAAEAEKFLNYLKSEPALAGFRKCGFIIPPPITQSAAIPTPSIPTRLSIGGEVKSPQLLEYTDDLTLLSALMAVGGFTNDADLKQVRLIRDGKQKTIDLSGARTTAKEDIPLRPGDSIDVLKASR